MSRLPGVTADTVRGWLSAADRDRLAGRLGEIIVALYQLPSPVIRDWWPADWPAFVAGQRARVSEQCALSLPALWADQIPRFPGGAGLLSRPPVLLHTEVMRPAPADRRRPERAWRLPGLTGFEPAMRADREYEVAGLRVFAAEEIAGSRPRTLTAYG
jgi:hygromycin-B 7''-O-kinase